MQLTCQVLDLSIKFLDDGISDEELLVELGPHGQHTRLQVLPLSLKPQGK
jgi:hypothetical protein